MNTNILSDITRNLLGAWYSDIKHLVDSLEKYDVEFDEIIDTLKMNYWEDANYDFNLIMYEILNTIAYKFINSNQNIFENHDDSFQLYVNYMDSHICFNDEYIQNEFERF